MDLIFTCLPELFQVANEITSCVWIVSSNCPTTLLMKGLEYFVDTGHREARRVISHESTPNRNLLLPMAYENRHITKASAMGHSYKTVTTFRIRNSAGRKRVGR